jgi:CHAD domain-containing protein
MKTRWDDRKDVAANLANILPRLAEDWFAAGADAMRKGADWDEMHRFRLLTKRFRYTLEIFEPLYGPGLRARIQQLRELQTHLGDVNDCITAEPLIGSGDDAKALRAALRNRARVKSGELRRFWVEKFGGAGPQAGWNRYLARFAGRRTHA